MSFVRGRRDSSHDSRLTRGTFVDSCTDTGWSRKAPNRRCWSPASTERSMRTARAANESVEPAIRLNQLVALTTKREERRHPGLSPGRCTSRPVSEQSWRRESRGFPDGPVPAAETLFEIGSITKVFTGLLLAIAVVRREVTLDTPVNALLPGQDAIPSRDGVQITMEHLATHRSGLPRSPVGLLSEGSRRPARRGPTPTRSGRRSGCSRPFRRPGCDMLRAPGRIAYSNLGAGLLGLALVAAAGAPSYSRARPNARFCATPGHDRHDYRWRTSTGCRSPPATAARAAGSTTGACPGWQERGPCCRAGGTC